ncbi:type II toxin-antitoxin system RelE/ParE family toxin [Rhodospirillum rubrum]|nr:type II toxin-antitoxin system RelE/ParE family toxin [Rhodospirillum rubrum]AEO48960.1 plasmid maintenance system killer [Rhodospirillum rubrum F11]QXG79205.1 type II toxin-antitoxin system RelE/ParE family toxin [Rhodospirillum rubrum]
MIRRFRTRALEDLFHDGTTRHIDKRHHRNCLLILDALNMATCARDLEGVKDFHPLKGNRSGEYAMHVSGNWCITFRFDGADITDIGFEDYH